MLFHTVLDGARFQVLLLDGDGLLDRMRPRPLREEPDTMVGCVLVGICAELGQPSSFYALGSDAAGGATRITPALGGLRAATRIAPACDGSAVRLGNVGETLSADHCLRLLDAFDMWGNDLVAS